MDGGAIASWIGVGLAVVSVVWGCGVCLWDNRRVKREREKSARDLEDAVEREQGYREEVLELRATMEGLVMVGGRRASAPDGPGHHRRNFWCQTTKCNRVGYFYLC